MQARHKAEDSKLGTMIPKPYEIVKAPKISDPYACCLSPASYLRKAWRHSSATPLPHHPSNTALLLSGGRRKPWQRSMMFMPPAHCPCWKP